MSYSQGQTTYNIFPVVAVPGQIYDARPIVVRSFCAASAINPGTLVEVTSNGSIQMCQDTGQAALANAVGIALLQTAREGIGVENFTTSTGGAVWNAGDMVEVLQVGNVWAAWSGTTQTQNGIPNVKHSSTVVTLQGYLTDASASNTVGSEVSVGPAWMATLFASTGSGNVIAVAVNFPGKY